MSDFEFDVAVVGGGLAGCSAAITLAKQGYRVGLFEAKAYPHDKVCGEFMSPECGDLLDELGVMPAIQALKPTQMTQTRITTPTGFVWDADMPAPAIGFSRYALDQLLADRARSLGVRVRERTTVTQIDGNLQTGFSLKVRSGGTSMQRGEQSPIRARVVIAAHGKRGNLDRALKRKFLHVPQPYIGLKTHFYGAPVPNRVELHTFPGGYCGLSEVEGDRVNACLLVRQETFHQVSGQNIDQFVTWMSTQNAHLGDWMQQARQVQPRWLSIASVPFVNKQVIERDVLMTGDAAGLIAPLAGDGMGMALAGGKLVADNVTMFLDGQTNTTQLKQYYATQWHRQFSGRLRLGRLLQAVMLRPHLVSPGLHVVRALPALGNYFITHTRDPQLAS